MLRRLQSLPLGLLVCTVMLVLMGFHPQPLQGAEVVRFVFAPDPVLDFMKDSGIIAEYELKYDMKLVNSATWDEFAFFAGGHADIASTGDYEVPVLAKETGLDFTIFGAYNRLPTTFIVRSDSPIKTLKDLKGKKIAVPGPVGATLIWGAMLKKLYGVDFRIGSKEYELFIEEHVVMPTLLRKGTVDAILVKQEPAAGDLLAGRARILPPNDATAWEFYRDNIDPQRKYGAIHSNIFVARTEYIRKHPKAIQFFLDMWQAGLDAWEKDRAGIVRMYPQHFPAKTDKERQWIIDYLNAGHDWWVKDIALDEEFIQAEGAMFDMLRETGYMEKDMPDPKFKAIPIESRQ
jgi:ABC-type nitrate/sulfonate/bicarbonate transport system substrate-binding protein